MMLRLPSLRALRAFEAMVRCGGVKEAADDLHVTPGAISQQLRRLEEELGAPLFERVGRTLAPNQHAKELAAELKLSFERIAAATERFRSKEAELAPLRVATLPSIATRLIVPALGELRESSPEIHLSFTYVHRIEDFSLDTADVLLCTVDGEYDKPGRVWRIFDGSVQPVCSPEYRASLGETPSPEELLGARLLHDWDTTGWERWFRSVGVAASKPLAGDVYEDLGLMGAAALAGQGVALCPTKLIEEELRRGDLVLLSNTATREERNYCVIVSEAPREDARLFADWVLQLGRRRSALHECLSDRAHSPASSVTRVGASRPVAP